MNAALGAALAERFPKSWRFQAESTAVLGGATAKQPDIVARPPGWRPVLIETEYHPADTVEKDVASRLGERYSPNLGGALVDQAVAVRIPKALSTTDQRRVSELLALPAADKASPVFEYSLHDLHPGDLGYTRRFPAEGWISGRIDDLADFIERASVSQATVEAAAQRFTEGVETAAVFLHETLTKAKYQGTDTERTYTDAALAIAASLHQKPGMDVWRMACAIIANALVFQSAIASDRGDVLEPSHERLKRHDGRISKQKLLETWDEILEINYWPIFHVARGVLTELPTVAAVEMLTHLAGLADDLVGLGATTTGDLSGQMIGALISERKFLATFYTLPTSAHLLAELATARLPALNEALNLSDSEKRSTSAAEAAVSLRIADLACGTGALLAAVYHRVGERLRRSGLDDSDLHSEMMESTFIGADIMPSAVHLTASVLSSVHPDVTFRQTRVHLLPYGKRTGTAGEISLGSLDLLDSEHSPRTLWESGRKAAGGEGDLPSEFVCDHRSADLVIMNPPFTRPTNHETAQAAGVPVPSFAGFGATDDEQRAMSKRLRGIYRTYTEQRAGHGNAGLASNFIDLAHAKVKPGGVIALVMPSAFCNGTSWSAARKLLEDCYREVEIISISATDATGRAFSADTGMAEILVIAARRDDDDCASDNNTVNWVSLTHRPRSIPEAVEIGKAVHSFDAKARSARLRIGKDRVGGLVRAGMDDGGCAHVFEQDVSEAAMTLSRGELVFPRIGRSFEVPTTFLGELGQRGPLSRDINGRNSDDSPRGPFDWDETPEGYRPTFPMIWRHDAKRETRLVVQPDSQGRVRHGCEERAATIWKTASRLHFTVDFRLNSQPLASCLTPEPCIGGRAWPSFKLDNPDWDPAAVLWANSTLGLIGFWWLGTRQHPGRSVLSPSRLPGLATLDPRQLSNKEIAAARDIFEYFADEDFLPANEAWNDPTRIALDKAVVIELLGWPKSVLEPLEVLRWQWCAEPTVHGGKDTRPGTPAPTPDWPDG